MRILAAKMVLGLALTLICMAASGINMAAAAVPTVTLITSTGAVPSGGAATLTWSSTDATSCTASNAWSGTLAASGTQSTGPLTKNSTFVLTCTGPGGVSPVIKAGINVVPIATLAASPTAVASGSAATLTWSSSNASACTASGGWSGALATNGTMSTGPVAQTTSYSLTCKGPAGTSKIASATVTVAGSAAPTVTLTTSSGAVASGGSATLTWNSTNATSCTASGGWSGTLATSGTQSTGALTLTTSYSITCSGAAGTSNVATATVTVAGISTPTASLITSTGAVVSGGSATLTWSSTNATACTASNAWSGALAASGTQSTGPLIRNSTFVLVCTGPGGISPVVKAGINVVPTASLTVSPASVAAGAAATLTWNSTNAASCTASGSWSGTLPTSGTQSTGPLAQNASYAIACKGPAGTSKVITALVTVSNTSIMSLSPRTAAITLSRSQQFTATVPGGGGATWTVDGIANGNSAVGTISSTGLYAAGTTAGAHAIVATSITNTSMSASAVAAVTDLAGVFTYRNNLARDGSNVQEYALNTGNVNTAGFGKIASCAVDGAIHGQPLWVANVMVSGVIHNVVYVATQHDSLYAFDADASPCMMLWRVSLIDATHGGLGGETSVPFALVGTGTGDIQPEIGVTGTPVIDAGSRILYVVSKSINSAQTTFYQRLHAIDLTTGNEKTGSPATLTGTYPGSGDGGSTVNFNAHMELQRTGLALVNGIVYIAWTAHEDAPPWYGWMMGYQYNGTGFAQTSVLNVAPNTREGGIWMSGGAPAADANNNLYVLTGNGAFDATNGSAPNNDYGDTLLQLNSSLHVTQYFTPSDQLTDMQNDKDFGAGGAAVLADLPAGNTVTHVLICGGKDGTLYVINRDLLGGFGDPGAVQPIVFGHGIFATGGFWNNNFYLGGINGPLNDFQVNTSNAHLTLGTSSTHVFGFAGAAPSISAAANQNGVVWALDTGSYCTHQAKSCGPVVLYAYDATNVGTELWNSSLTSADAAGYPVKFSVPTVANGKVYVGTRGNNIGGIDTSTSVPGELDIYGLKP